MQILRQSLYIMAKMLFFLVFYQTRFVLSQGGFLAALSRAPLSLGYIAGGMIVGPYGMKLVTHMLQIQTLAQIGTVFMMFQHGIEYPVDHRTFRKRYCCVICYMR